MKEINYNKDGEAVSDFDVERWLTLFLESTQSYWSMSSEIVITALRVRIRKHPELLAKVKVTVGADCKPFDIDADGRSADHHLLSCLWDEYLLELV